MIPTPIHQEKAPSIEWRENPVQYLRAKQDSDGSKLFSAFLDAYGRGIRRDRIESSNLHSYTVLDGQLSRCNSKVVDKLMNPLLKKLFTHRSGTFKSPNKSNFLFRVCLFAIPHQQDGDPVDVASLLHYQKDRVNPSTFAPLDYFSRRNDAQEFIAVKFETQMGKDLLPVAEYLCPYTRLATQEETAAELLRAKPAVQIRKMDKALIEPSLAHIAALFKRIVKPTTKYEPDTLKRDLAELVHKWTFISPFEQEDLTFIDLVQTTLAALHGYKMETHENIYHTALSKPYFPSFAQDYFKDVKLTQ